MTDSPPTVVILTALPVEYAAVRAHLSDVVRREDDYGTVFDCGRLADTGLTAAVALIGEGNENAALITGQAYNLFGPRALLFVGVAGALSEDLEIGDVVVATRIYAYHGAKVNPGASLARPRAWDASWRLLQAAYRATHEPDVTVHYKPIAAGEVVLNDRASNLSEHLEKNYNDAVAIEMESAGVARAAHVSGRLDTLTIRCISDKADGRKREADAKGTQRIAASRAATIAVAVLREFAKSVVARPDPGHGVGALAAQGGGGAGSSLPAHGSAVGADAGASAGPGATGVPEPAAMERPAPEPAAATERPVPEPAAAVERSIPESAAATERPAPEPAAATERPAPEPAPTAERPVPEPVATERSIPERGAQERPAVAPPPTLTGPATRQGPVSPALAVFSDGPGTGRSAPSASTATPLSDPPGSSAPAAPAASPGTDDAAAGPGAARVPGRKPAHRASQAADPLLLSGLRAPLLRGLRAARRHLTPLRATALAFVLILGALVPVLFSGDDGAGPGPGNPFASSLPTCPADKADTTLRIAASIDLSKSLQEAAADYGARRTDGHCVKIAVSGVNSGTAMRALAKGWTEADGPTPPDVWSPAGSEWLALARTKATPKALERLPETAQPIVTSPLTIAMPKTMATALGWPEQRIGWKDLAKWAEDPADFWTERGEKQWGALKLGKTNPHYSTSGLNATIGAFYARTGTSGELSAKDIDAPANQALVKTIEKSVVHYGDTTLTFLANLRAADDSGGEDEATRYISAVTVEENAVVAYNQGYPCGAYSDEPECAKTDKPRTPLVSLYPKDSNPVSDHPYVTLNDLPAAKGTVSADFLHHLHDPAVYKKYFAPYGYRTHDRKPGPSITEQNGALPGTELSAYNAPKGPALERIQQTWSRLRRPAHVLVVIDTSLSMEDKVPGTGKTKMQLLKDAEPALFGEFGPADRVGLWKFSNAANLDGKHHYKELMPIGPMDGPAPGADGVTRRKQLTTEVGALVPNGATGLYGTVDAAAKALREDYDPDAINAIVLLTDGRNEGVPARPTLEEVLSRVGGSDHRIRIFTIAYGSDADEQDAGGRTVLGKIAAATGARAYDAKDPRVIGQVLTSVISNF
ncbi:hypothetical protein ACFYWX_45320 [Streptomyces sp. NPDC002888]|uniref:phosphorylase family protein n=1 Tax=Streptomyces sp. NPDC002888 TaxID=3364668 RepID=UPI00367A578F